MSLKYITILPARMQGVKTKIFGTKSVGSFLGRFGEKVWLARGAKILYNSSDRAINVTGRTVTSAKRDCEGITKGDTDHVSDQDHQREFRG